MKRIVTGKEMKALDRDTIEEMGVPSLVLMERAGLAAANALRESEFPLEKVLILCGSGNNGADGVVIARLLHLWGYQTDVCILGNPEHFTEEMKKQIDIGKKYGLSFVKTFHQKEYTTIVDAIFGVGLSREVTGIYGEVIRNLSHYQGKILSVDIPSGISADTGQILGCAVHADLTVTFAFLKAGLCLYPGASYAGKLLVADVGIYAPKKEEGSSVIFACEKRDLEHIVRKPEGNKGTFGKILLVAGSSGMFGAAYLQWHGSYENRSRYAENLYQRRKPQPFFLLPGSNASDLWGGYGFAGTVGRQPGLGGCSGDWSWAWNLKTGSKAFGYSSYTLPEAPGSGCGCFKSSKRPHS